MQKKLARTKWVREQEKPQGTMQVYMQKKLSKPLDKRYGRKLARN